MIPQPDRKKIVTRSKTKPPPVAVIAENITADLKALRRWVLWKWVWVKKREEWTKPPFTIRGRNAKSNDPTTWTTFDEVMAAYERRGFDGIGIMLSPDDDDLVGIDLDGCRDPETGIVDPWAIEEVQAFNSYAEMSPSQTGLRIFCRGKLPSGNRKDAIREAYDRGRYLTITGQRLPDSPTTVEHRQPEIEAFQAKIGGKQTKAETKATNGYTTGLGPDDNTILSKAMTAKNGDKFKALWEGVIAGYGDDESAADLAFCSMLAFYTGPDHGAIDRLFRQSCLYREKWEREDYRRRTIDKALEGRTEFYKWRQNFTVQDAVDATNRAPEGDGPDSQQSADPICATDIGNAKRLVRKHGRDIRYCHPWAKWLIWDGTRWRIDDTGTIKLLAKSVILELFKEVQAKVAELSAAVQDDEDDEKAKAKLRQIKAILNWALKSQFAMRINAMIELARSEPGIPIMPSQLDQNNLLLNCKNGTLDLKTGKLLTHKRQDHLTKLAPVNYDPGATCPLWELTVCQIFDDSSMLVEYLQRVLGYCLTGEVIEHILAIFWGMGANGKSTIINLILAMLGGDYAGKAGRDLLMAAKNDKHPTAMAWLFGKRFVVAMESAEGARLDEALIKELTGGDRITARGMREDYWSFDPTHTVALVTNHKPEVRGTDHGIWRRLKLLPFEVTFADDKQDKALPEKLKAELPGILAWCVRGCLEWQQHGLCDPPEVKAATGSYRQSQDVLASFITERCVTGNPNYRIRAGQLHAAFMAWCKSTGEMGLVMRRFGQAIRERGFESTTNNGTWYLGIALTQESVYSTEGTEGTDPLSS